MDSTLMHDPAIQLGAILVVVTLLLDWLLRRILRRALADGKAGAAHRHRYQWFAALSAPLSLLVWYAGLYVVVRILLDSTMPAWLRPYQAWIEDAAGIGAFFALVWLMRRTTLVIEEQMRRAAEDSSSTVDTVLFPLTGMALRVVVPVLALFFLIRLWPFDPTTLALLRKLIGVALIGCLAWIVNRGTVLAEKAIVAQQKKIAGGEFAVRSMLTRVSVLRKVVMVLVTVFALAGVLMMFEEVRDLGRSLLASAGVAGIILGFAAQRSLGALFAGLQIAFTQPVRIGDLVKAEEELGIVEEITLTYVSIRLWDRRCLVLPISYFIEHPALNYTRGASEMVVPVLLRMDFSLPVPELRDHLQDWLEHSAQAQWDHRLFSVQVTKSDQTSMELCILASAVTPAAALQLQLALREETIDFVHRCFPQSLPKSRGEGKTIQTWRETEEFGARSAAPAETAPAALR